MKLLLLIPFLFCFGCEFVAPAVRAVEWFDIEHGMKKQYQSPAFVPATQEAK